MFYLHPKVASKPKPKVKTNRDKRAKCRYMSTRGCQNMSYSDKKSYPFKKKKNKKRNKTNWVKYRKWRSVTEESEENSDIIVSYYLNSAEKDIDIYPLNSFYNTIIFIL